MYPFPFKRELCVGSYILIFSLYLLVGIYTPTWADFQKGGRNRYSLSLESELNKEEFRNEAVDGVLQR